jgi:prepilin-type processing-associated H-X9-DG protein
LFPVFAAAREKARQSTCANNEKQLGLGMLQYAQDYDEAFTYMNSGWACRVYGYVKSAAVYTCPDDPAPYTSTDQEVSYILPLWRGAVGGSVLQSQFVAPAMTVMLYEGQGCSGYNIADTNYPTDANSDNNTSNGSYMDQTNGRGNVRGGNTSGTWIRVYATGPMGRADDEPFTNYFHIQEVATNGVIAGRHSGGANYLAVDGHVKWLMGSLVSTGTVAKAQDCNQDGGSADGDATCGASGSQSGYAAGTSGTINGTPVTLTFSPT